MALALGRDDRNDARDSAALGGNMGQAIPRTAADLHWLAFLLTGCPETSADVVIETIGSEDVSSVFFSAWMAAWSRRLVIAKALAAIREDLAASARRTEFMDADRSPLPAPAWALAQGTSKLRLQRALADIDLFPRAAVLLSIFEGMPINDAAIVLDASPDLVRKGQMVGLRGLTHNLARMQGWGPAAHPVKTRSEPEVFA